jgi:predicted transcriptional regulator
MELAWKKAKPTITVREVFEALKRERQIAYTTVMTTMVRLAEKGTLKIVDKIGLANCYAPVESREAFLANAVNRVLEIFMKEFPRECSRYLEPRMQLKRQRKPSRSN